MIQNFNIYKLKAAIAAGIMLAVAMSPVSAQAVTCATLGSYPVNQSHILDFDLPEEAREFIHQCILDGSDPPAEWFEQGGRKLGGVAKGVTGHHQRKELSDASCQAPSLRSKQEGNCEYFWPNCHGTPGGEQGGGALSCEENGDGAGENTLASVDPVYLSDIEGIDQDVLECGIAMRVSGGLDGGSGGGICAAASGSICGMSFGGSECIGAGDLQNTGPYADLFNLYDPTSGAGNDEILIGHYDGGISGTFIASSEGGATLRINGGSLCAECITGSSMDVVQEWRDLIESNSDLELPQDSVITVNPNTGQMEVTTPEVSFTIDGSNSNQLQLNDGDSIHFALPSDDGGGNPEFRMPEHVEGWQTDQQTAFAAEQDALAEEAAESDAPIDTTTDPDAVPSAPVIDSSLPPTPPTPTEPVTDASIDP